MDAVEFLRLVVPTQGAVCISTASGGWSDTLFTSREDAVAYAMQCAQSKDVYFGLSGFGPGGRRLADNALWQRALWADIDVGPDKAVKGAGYATIPDALQALGAFTERGHVPWPTVVCSGYGLHLYWPLTDDISRDEWLPLAKGFKSLCEQHGFKVDPARACDAASVLRLPGTLNHKRGGLAPVEVWQVGEVTTPASWHNLLATSAPAIPADAMVALAANFGSFEAPSGPSRDWYGLVEKCRAVRDMAKAPYPAWLLAARTVLHTNGGDELVHQLSSLAPEKYDAVACDKLLRSLHGRTDIGPGTCDTFAAEWPEVCADCPHRGKIRTPWVLAGLPEPEPVRMAAATVETADLSQPELQVSSQQTMDVLPFRSDDGEWQVVPGQGIFHQSVDEDGSPTLTRITTTELYIHTLCVDASQGSVPNLVYVMRKVVPGQAPVDIPFSLDDAFGGPKQELWLAKCKLMPPPKYKKLMLGFMNTYLSVIQNNLPEIRVRTHFGWNTERDRVTAAETECLIVGQTAYSAAGEKPVRLDERALGLLPDFAVLGTVEQWRKVPDLYRDLDQPFAQLMMCASFGAPLMCAGLGTATNVAYSLWDAAGGKGKSSVLRACASVWGDPSKMLMGRNDTAAARFQHFAVYKNLPILIDEITSMRDADLASMLYDIVNGREKARSASGGGALMARGSWDTITMMTSNTSVYEALRDYRAQTTATAMRVIELPCDFKDYTGLPESAKVNAALSAARDNYGVAGREFAKFITTAPGIKPAVAAYAAEFAVKYAQSSDERFWLYGIAIPLIAGRIACQLGLLGYDMDALETWCINELLPRLRLGAKQERPQGGDLTAAFLNDRLDCTLIVRAKSRQAWAAMPHDGPPVVAGGAMSADPYVVQLPTRKLEIRRELDSGTTYVATKALRGWAKEQGLSVDALLQDLANRGYLPWGTAPVRKQLGQDVPALPDVRSHVYKLKVGDGNGSAIYGGSDESREATAAWEAESVSPYGDNAYGQGPYIAPTSPHRDGGR